MSNHCPCCSNKPYEQCCGQYLDQGLFPETPELLMRSRYTAYTRAYMKYIKRTMQGNAALHFDYLATQQWAKKVKWLKLEILKTDFSENSPKRGFVEFIAHYEWQDELQRLHEISEFQQIDGRWYYVDGLSP